MIRVYFFCSCIPRPSLFLSALSSLGHHIYLVTMNFKINPVFKNYNLFLQISLHMLLFGAFLLAHPVKNPLAMQETLVWFLGREVYLEKRQAPHSSIPGLPWGLRQWRIRLQCRRPGFDPWAEKIRWRRAWRPTPVLLPGESHGQSIVAWRSPWTEAPGGLRSTGPPLCSVRRAWATENVSTRDAMCCVWTWYNVPVL